MLAAADAGQTVVAAVLGLGAAGVAGGVVAMAWSLHLHQIQAVTALARDRARSEASGLAEPLGSVPPAHALNGNGQPDAADGGGPRDPGPGGGVPYPPGGGPRAPRTAAATRAAQFPSAQSPRAQSPSAQSPRAQPLPAQSPRAAPSPIEGPDSVVTGEQARYRVRRTGAQQVVSWAVGGGAVSQASDPEHPDDLLLVADRPGSLTVSVRLREGLAERRETKAVAAVARPEAAPPAVASRLLLQDWPVITVAVLVVGFAAALVAVGSLPVGDFIALAAPLTAVLAVVAATRGPGAAGGRPGR